MDGILFTRFLKSIANGQGANEAAIAFTEQQKNWDGFHKSVITSRIKAAVSGLSTPDTGGASEVAHDFLAAFQPWSVIPRLNLRRVPTKTSILTAANESAASFVGQGQGRQLCAGEYVRDNMPLLTVAGMTCATNEQLANPSWDAEIELKRSLLAACGKEADRVFLDPANAGITDVCPASVTSAATPIFVQGSAIGNLDAAIASAIGALVAAGSNLSSASWVCSPVLAAGLSLARGSNGALAYPGMGATGGSLIGLPCLTSSVCTPDSDGYFLTLIDGASISYAEDLPTLSISRHASIELSDAPTGNTTAPTASSSLVSMYQSDTTALLASLACNWRLRREGGVQLIGGVPSTFTAS